MLKIKAFKFLAVKVKGKYCGACHNGQAAFASNTKCATCHIEVKGLKEYQKKLSQGSKK